MNKIIAAIAVGACFAACPLFAVAGESPKTCAGGDWVRMGPPTMFENDLYGALRSYLTRARAGLALSTPSLSGFAVLADTEAAKIPGTLKSQGLAFDGDAPVFSWRYGLQRA